LWTRAGIDGRTFVDRQLQGAYLRWVYDRAVADLPSPFALGPHTDGRTPEAFTC
jgi:hypothetical protein